MELVVILTKSGQHYEHSKTCLLNNLNVIVEKPMSLRIDHVQELINISTSNGKFCGSIFQNRLNPAVVATKMRLKKRGLEI